MSGPAPERWHRLKGELQGKAVVDIAEALWRDHAPFRKRVLEATSWYEGFRLLALDANSYNNAAGLRVSGQSEERAGVYWNTPRSLVHSVAAKVAGRQRPKAQIVCTDADWPTKRRAKRLERFVEATMYQPQGMCRDAWELGNRAFVDCLVWGMGVLKIYADLELERPAVDRILPWEVLVNPREAELGAPLNLFHRYRIDRDRLTARFPQFAAEIARTKDDAERTPAMPDLRATRSCVVYEAWRLPLGPKDPGCHVIAIDGKLLVSEKWNRNEFPFIVLRYAPHLLGWGASSLVEEAIPVATELNTTIQRMGEGERKLAAGVVIAEEGSISDEQLVRVEIGAILTTKPGSPPPTVMQPQGFSESTLQWMRLHWEKCFELTGVSQMSATSRKEPGVTAGIALRTIATMETERFSVIFTAYEQALAVDAARHLIAAAREVEVAKPGLVARWPGGRFLREIKLSEADLEDDKYVLQAHAVSGIINTPQDRLQLGQDLFNSGIIGPDSFVRIAQLKDVESELRGRDVQYELVQDYIESWLEATPEGEETGSFRYRGPLPFMNHPEAILQCATAYMQSQLDGAPDYNLEFFTRYITQCDGFVARAQQTPPVPPAPAQQVPGGAAPMPPPSGGPSQMLN